MSVFVLIVLCIFLAATIIFLIAAITSEELEISFMLFLLIVIGVIAIIFQAHIM